ncbi:hypothetical protein MNV_1120010 [Candidatus Methanoperedens nitroreducens]|uniref:Uncharacterized protein n=1 Tax=Candidatus Methanoperedens nitratireducens TaxID=1392998 RepID=A0A284VJ62_9EURY|nr:hypothetical protein MNV_1120010 [Candidatus Methanoperedens nitroreducens]
MHYERMTPRANNGECRGALLETRLGAFICGSFLQYVLIDFLNILLVNC